MYSLGELKCLFRFECTPVDDPRTARQRVLSFDLSSLDCQPERDATYLKMIRGLVSVSQPSTLRRSAL